MSTKIKPFADHILIEPLHEEKKNNVIILPDTIEKEQSEKGLVIAVGRGRLDENNKTIPLSIRKGDKVLFTKYSPNKFKVNEKEYLIIQEKDILATIE